MSFDFSRLSDPFCDSHESEQVMLTIMHCIPLNVIHDPLRYLEIFESYGREESSVAFTLYVVYPRN